jgi:hypothetical protein
MCRCKSCDSILEESEIVWIEEKQQHEDLCRCCRKIIFDLENNYSPYVLVLGEEVEYEHI